MKVNEKLSVLFLLEKSKASKDGMAPIWARITVTGSPRAEFSLAKKVSPQWWDQESERVILKDNPNKKEARQINSAITLVLAEIQKQYQAYETLLGTSPLAILCNEPPFREVDVDPYACR